MPSVTIAVAALQGKLAKQADVSLKVWRSPDQLRAGVASGQFKVMMSPSNVGVNLRNQGQKVGMVNILTNGITQLVCKGSGDCLAAGFGRQKKSSYRLKTICPTSCCKPC